MDITPDIKEKILGILSVLFPTASIYLFGSRARHTASPMSDIDLAIDEKTIISSGRIGEAKAMFNESSIPLQIDIVDFHNIPPRLQETIKREGVIWKQ